MNKSKALALGSFDGLHLGHAKVIKKITKLKSEYEPCALLFDEHPLKVLSSKSQPLLISNEEKADRLKAAGVKPIAIKFTDIMNLSPEEFVRDFLSSLSVKAVSCGHNFHFAKNAAGNSEILFELCKKYDILLSVADDVTYKGELISSSRIRDCLRGGNIHDANAMLGRNYSYTLPVIRGNHIGNTLGFPTINQQIPDDLVKLRFGVYLTKTTICGQDFASVTNFGIRPTVGGNKQLLETYILDYTQDLYGQSIQISFLDFLRDERKFNSLSELKEQIKKDKKQAAEYFGSEIN